MLETKNLNGAKKQQLNIAGVSGWHLIYEQPPLENDYIELMFDNGLTTKRHWTLSVFDETTMIKPMYWRDCQ
jgi:hypothetical protein